MVMGSSPVEFFPTDRSRTVAKEATVTLRNRFAEHNPVLNDGQVSLIARPAMKKFAEIGTGPVRKVYTAEGVFNNDLFAVSGLNLYRIKNDASSGNKGQLTTTLTGGVSMAATAPIGTTPAYLFIATGGILWVYTDNGQASGNLHVSGTISSGSKISINGVYYAWTSGSVDASSPAGTSANPWLVKLGVDNATSMTEMYLALSQFGTPGVDYSTGLSVHQQFYAYSVTATDLFVVADSPGIAGNGMVLTASGGVTWTAGTLTGGGSEQLRQVNVPGDYGAISLAVINSFVIVVPVQAAGIKGQFYWIQPGNTRIDPLDFATAERSPDGVKQVIVFGDLFWLLGEVTVEPWRTTGNAAAPMLRYDGILIDRGSFAGSGIQIKDSFLMTDQDGGVFEVAGQATRVSTPDIEEKIRKAIQKAALLEPYIV